MAGEHPHLGPQHLCLEASNCSENTGMEAKIAVLLINLLEDWILTSRPLIHPVVGHLDVVHAAHSADAVCVKLQTIYCKQTQDNTATRRLSWAYLGILCLYSNCLTAYVHTVAQPHSCW